MSARPLFNFFADIGEKFVPVLQEQIRVSTTYIREAVEKLRNEFWMTEPEAGDVTTLLLGDIMEIEDAPKVGLGVQRNRKPV